jgi:polysaccharide deacetylase 2 family uncharacterized protein YibQ
MSRKKKGRKKRGPSLYTSFVAFSGAAALFLGSLLYLAFLGEKSSQPLFEERASLLSRQIARIDQAIYTCLYKAKVPQKNILFLDVKPRHRDRAEWDFTELLIRVPRQESVATLEKELKEMLSSRAPDLRFRAARESHGGAVVQVYAGGYETHRIRIRPDPRTLAESANQEIPPLTTGERAFPPGPDGGMVGNSRADAQVPANRESTPRVSIIIDDLGYDLDLAKSLMGLDLGVSLSVLPVAPFTKKIVEAAQEKKYEVILHLPMEAETYRHEDAGPGALLTNMSEKEIKRLLEEHLKRVPGARGVNNHMGSRFTESEDKMGILMKELKRRGLFYVDSRTTSRTVALEVAQRLGVPAAKRDVFLDNDLSQEAMTFQLQRLLTISRQSGRAIGIAHPHPETVTFLRQNLPLLKREASVVCVSEIVE